MSCCSNILRAKATSVSVSGNASVVHSNNSYADLNDDHSDCLAHVTSGSDITSESKYDLDTNHTYVNDDNLSNQ